MDNNGLLSQRDKVKLNQIILLFYPTIFPTRMISDKIISEISVVVGVTGNQLFNLRRLTFLYKPKFGQIT